MFMKSSGPHVLAGYYNKSLNNSQLFLCVFIWNCLYQNHITCRKELIVNIYTFRITTWKISNQMKLSVVLWLNVLRRSCVNIWWRNMCTRIEFINSNLELCVPGCARHSYMWALFTPSTPPQFGPLLFST